MCLADEFVELSQDVSSQKPEDVARFCHWVAVNGVGDFTPHSHAEFVDGSRARRVGYPGEWVVQS